MQNIASAFDSEGTVGAKPETGLIPKGIRNSHIYAEVDFTAEKMVNLCYDLVQLFGYQRDSLTIECR